MTPLRVIIVDDEELGRRGVRARLVRMADVEIAAEAKTADDAVKAIRAHKPDLVFLDVQMPRKTGFEVIREIGEDAFPYVIFVTAHDDFAVQAFRVNALDYLLKPIDDKLFAEAVRRARAAIEKRDVAALGQRLTSLMHGQKNADDHFIVRSPGRVVMIPFKNIDWVEAAGDYVNVHAGKKTWLFRDTIAAVEERLSPRGFARIHRSIIVNMKRIEEIRALDNGDHQVVLKDGQQLRLSRNFRSSLERITSQAI